MKHAFQKAKELWRNFNTQAKCPKMPVSEPPKYEEKTHDR